MNAPHEKAPIVFGITRKSLEGVKVFACQKCGAPGLYKNDEHNRKHWPGIVDAKLVGQPVGDTCPNCGARRKPNKNLGELTSSMPRWIWQCILGVKWIVVQLRRPVMLSRRNRAT